MSQPVQEETPRLQRARATKGRNNMRLLLWSGEHLHGIQNSYCISFYYHQCFINKCGVETTTFWLFVIASGALQDGDLDLFWIFTYKERTYGNCPRLCEGQFAKEMSQPVQEASPRLFLVLKLIKKHPSPAIESPIVCLWLLRWHSISNQFKMSNKLLLLPDMILWCRNIISQYYEATRSDDLWVDAGNITVDEDISNFRCWPLISQCGLVMTSIQHQGFRNLILVLKSILLDSSMSVAFKQER